MRIFAKLKNRKASEQILRQNKELIKKLAKRSNIIIDDPLSKEIRIEIEVKPADPEAIINKFCVYDAVDHPNIVVGQEDIEELKIVF